MLGQTSLKKKNLNAFSLEASLVCVRKIQKIEGWNAADKKIKHMDTNTPEWKHTHMKE